MNEIFRLRKYLEYQWRAKTKYYIHSPFVYQFYLNVLEGEEDILAKNRQEKFLYRLTKYFRQQNILVLGGFDFSAVNPELKIYSIHNFSGIIQWKNYPSPDLIFFDSNFYKEIILEYFYQSLSHKHENSIFIFDNIYRSKEMNDVWGEIKKHPQVTLTIDLFQFGICFFRKDKLAKENFVLRY